MGSFISGLFGGGQSDAQAGQTAALQEARDAAHAYRPEAMQARLNLLSKASGAYQGMNNALETMYGGRRAPLDGKLAERPEGLDGRMPTTFGGHPMPQQPQQPPGQPPTAPAGPQGASRPILSTVFDPAGIFKGLF